MRLPRVSIASTVVGIVIVSIWLAILREDLTNGTVWSHGHFLIIGVLPMACLLIWVMLIGIVGLSRRGECPPFLVGFEGGGWVTLFLMVVYDAATDDSSGSPLSLADPLHQWLLASQYIYYNEYVVLLFHAILFFIPPLITFVVGGWLSWRLGVRLVMRRHGKFGDAGGHTKAVADRH